MNTETLFENFFKKLGMIIDWKIIDDLVVSDANILRPVRGHAFEYLFDLVAQDELKTKIESGTGDTDIDRIIFDISGNRHTLQLKTYIRSSVVNGKKFAVNLHKTHGIEKRPYNLYPKVWPCPTCEHDGESFPDFLVVLHPEKGVVIIPKDKINESRTFPGHYADPFTIDWDSEWLNRWDLLGFPEHIGKSLERRSVPEQEKLPQTSKLVLLTDIEIVSMWLKPENFRTIEMNLKGNLREPALVSLFSELGHSIHPPKHSYPKHDKETVGGSRIQIKGLSKAFRDIDNDQIGVEVMGTHGKGAIRCYADEDFDYLGIVIDPNYLDSKFQAKKDVYQFCLIPITDLPLHYKNSIWNTSNKIYPLCKFKVGKDEKGIFLVPAENYRNKIVFRGKGPWYLNTIPSTLKL